MKKIIAFSIFFLFFNISFSQLTISGISKDASCNSSGEVTLNVTGGNGIYSYRMTANNCAEVIPPTQSTNVFKSLSTCSYTFEVQDSDGKKGTVTVSVGGNYQAPLVTPTANACTFSVGVSRGTPPYKYELSTDNGNTWNTSTQPSWTQMPNGNYLIRVTDACNVSRLVSATVALDTIEYYTSIVNLFNNANRDSFEVYGMRGGKAPYTIKLLVGKDTILGNNGKFSWKTLPPKTCDNVKVIVQHACGVNVQRLKMAIGNVSCVSFADGSAKMDVFWGVPPYQYYAYDENNIDIRPTSNVINNLKKNSIYYSISGQDACMDPVFVLKSNYFNRPEIVFKTKPDCSANTTAALQISPAVLNQPTYPDIYQIECTTCNPVSTTRLESGKSLIISNLSINGKNTIKIKDTCGGTWTCTSEIVLSQFIGCDSAAFKMVNSFLCDNRPSAFSFSGDTILDATYVLKNNSGTILSTNKSGLFGELAPGIYKMEATATGCQTLSSNFEIKKSNVTIQPSVGFYRGIDFSLQSRPCADIYTLFLPTEYLPYTLRDSTGKLVNESGRNGNSNVYFNNLRPGKYTAKSFSTCTVKEIILPEIKPTLKVEEIKSCPAGGSITLSGGKDYKGWDSFFKSNGLTMQYFYSPADWYDTKNSSLFNYDTARKTYFNVLPNQKYRFYVYSAFYQGLSETTCPSDSIEVTMPSYIPPTVQTNLSLLCGGNSGIIQLKVKNGTSPFSVQRKDATFTNSIGGVITSNDSLITISNLIADTYYFTLTDACGNTANVQSTLTSLDSITAFKNCDGSVALSFYRLTGAKYTWKQGVTILSDSSSLIIPNPIKGSRYTLDFTFNTCSTTRSFILSEDIPVFKVNVSTTKTNLTLCPGNDSIVLTASSIGTPSTSLVWNTGDTSRTIKVTKAGTYTVTVKNRFDCTSTESIQVVSSPAILAELNKKDISCYGRSDGEIIVVPGGGTNPLAYRWNTGVTTLNLSNAKKGIYSVTITDAKNCTWTDSAEIKEPDSIKITSTIKNQTCSGVNDGAITVNTTGGTVPYTFNWSNTISTASLSNLTAGIYKLSITDSRNCTLSRDFDIQVAPKIVVTKFDTICFGSKLTIGSDIFDKTGNYSIDLKNTIGCDSTVQLRLFVRDSLHMTVQSKSPLCFGVDDGRINISAINTRSPYQYFLNEKRMVSGDTSKLKPGIYSLRLNDRFGCTAARIIQLDTPKMIQVDLGKDTTLVWGDSIKLKYTISNADRSIIFRTTFNGIDLKPCINCQEVFAVPLNKSTVKVTVETKDGCQITDEQIIHIDFSYKVFAPNVFYPSGQNNTRFTLFTGRQAESIKYLRIFNRWGTQIYSQQNLIPNDPANGWDGSFKNIESPAGVYAYDAIVIFRDGTEHRVKGDVTLVR